MSSVYPLVIIAAVIASGVSLQPIEEDLDWESFEAALMEDSEDEGISLLQNRASVIKRTVSSTNAKAPQNVPEPAKILSFESMDDLSLDAFAEYLQSEEMPLEAVSLVQTDAHFERKAVAHQMAVATDADGSNVVVEPQRILPEAGMMHMSVGADGKFHFEDGIDGVSLLQTESKQQAPLNGGFVGSSVEQAPLAEANKEMPLEAVSLVQTDAHFERKAVADLMAVATDADGSNVVVEPPRILPEAGMMHMSVGADGKFHFEDGIDGVSLLQTESKQQAPLNGGFVGSSAEQAPLAEANKESPGGLSLMQTAAQIEHKAVITEADGQNVEELKRPLPENGVMHMSVAADGHLHYEV